MWDPHGQNYRAEKANNYQKKFLRRISEIKRPNVNLNIIEYYEALAS